MSVRKRENRSAKDALKCDHGISDIKFEINEVRSPHHATHVLKVQIVCASCGAKIRFLGLPSSFVPDCPHPGDDNSSVFLPAFWADA